MPTLVYRSGSATDDNLTPRAGKDTLSRPGQAPGLSTFTRLELTVAPGDKAQVIDLDLLQWPHRGIEDDPLDGGHEGHISIAPVTKEGEVDQELLEEWAKTRGTDRVHALTELVRNALVETNIRRPR
jgi:hypothetical protein